MQGPTDLYDDAQVSSQQPTHLLGANVEPMIQDLEGHIEEGSNDDDSAYGGRYECSDCPFSSGST